ncbi:hypothetical protein B0A48_12068 [Cryoendolithus antarcticus]|uniref:C2H2-type domain-containing protein n=1 Tax=Cryoendolithus antarcticus TaxID=1507870 RepID=A0A1V8SU32_9PEZI|nr:hypothetical protein B0A48_12068 [Cryoendolithus antarcticus]
MAGRGEQPGGYQRELQRAEAYLAAIGHVGSQIDNEWSYRGPSHASIPLPDTTRQYITRQDAEQSLEQIVDGFSPSTPPSPFSAYGVLELPARTIDPRIAFRQRQVPSYIPVIPERDLYGPQHPRAVRNGPILPGYPKAQRRAEGQRTVSARERPPRNGRAQRTTALLYPESTAAIRGQDGPTQSIERTLANLTAVLEEPSPFVCKECGRVCTDRQSLRHHFSNVHDEAKKTQHKCPVCQRGFPYRASVEKHVNSVHRQRGDPNKVMYSCPDCRKQFDRLYNMQRHHDLIHPDSLAIVRTVQHSGPPRRAGAYVQQPLGLIIPMRTPSPPATAFSLRRNGDSYSQVARLGYHAESMTRAASQASAPSTIFSDPGTPFTRPTFETTPTEVDESWLDPTLRSKRGTPSARSSLRSQW